MQLGVDMNSVKASFGDSDPIPEGTYLVSVLKDELMNNKKGTGIIAKFELNILSDLEGNIELKGRKLFSYFNVRHQNQQAQNIGLSQLKGFALAAGHASGNLNDTNELRNRQLAVSVGIEEDQNGVPRNRIKKYLPLEEDITNHAVRNEELSKQQGRQASPLPTKKIQNNTRQTPINDDDIPF